MPRTAPCVRLIGHTPQPEKTIAAAAKLCYCAATIDTLLEDLTDEKAADFVGMLAEIGHESPIEHASFTFAIEGVSRALLAQITRHRIASFSVQSQRYVRENSFDYLLPPALSQIPQAAQLFDEAMQSAQEYYDRLAELLKKYHTENLMKMQNLEERQAARKAEKMAIEDARFVLPNACDTKMVVTMNARSLLNFFSHRCCNRAQWEIREVADQMLALVSEVAPNLFAKAGPSCVRGGCTEGKMSCGQPQQVKEHIAAIKQGAKQ